MVLCMAIGSHGPDRVLETHGRPHVRSRVETTKVGRLVDEGTEVLLFLEEYGVPRAVSRRTQRHPPEGWPSTGDWRE